jgi:hypothetical protein
MAEYASQLQVLMYPYDTRFNPLPVPTSNMFDAPRVCIEINTQWVSHLDGLLARLLWRDAWTGDESDVDRAIAQVSALIARLGVIGDCMACCDDLIAELDLIKAQLARAARLNQSQIRVIITQTQNDYHDYIINNYTDWGDDITNVYPQLGYGNSGDANRDKALCIICHRFVDLVSDWVIKNIDAKVANQQTVLDVTELVAAAAGLGAWLFGELSYGAMFRNIQDTLDAEVPILSGWITSVSAGARSAFQDTVARDDVACAWYNVLKGATPTATSFVASISGLSLTGNAETIRAKIADALVPVTEPTQPSQEHVFFIFAALWDQAIQAAIQGIVLDDCLCVDAGLTPVIDTSGAWVGGGYGGSIAQDGNFWVVTATAASATSDMRIVIKSETGVAFLLTDLTYPSGGPSCTFWTGSPNFFDSCGFGIYYPSVAMNQFGVTNPYGIQIRFRMIAA